MSYSYGFLLAQEQCKYNKYLVTWTKRAENNSENLGSVEIYCG